MLKILLLSLSTQYTVDGQYIPSLFIEPEVRHDKTSYTFSMLFSRADLRESMIFYDFFSRPMFARMFSLLVYLRGQCNNLKQEHLSYLFIDSL